MYVFILVVQKAWSDLAVVHGTLESGLRGASVKFPSFQVSVTHSYLGNRTISNANFEPFFLGSN